MSKPVQSYTHSILRNYQCFRNITFGWERLFAKFASTSRKSQYIQHLASLFIPIHPPCHAIQVCSSVTTTRSSSNSSVSNVLRTQPYKSLKVTVVPRWHQEWSVIEQVEPPAHLREEDQKNASEDLAKRRSSLPPLCRHLPTSFMRLITR